MTVRQPTAKVIIQEQQGLGGQAEGVDEDPTTAPAFSFEWPRPKFTATIDGAAGKEGAANVLNLEVTGLPQRIVDRIDVDGFVRIDAGYEKGNPEASPAPVFYGSIQDIGFHRQGAEVRHTITAHTNPSRIRETFVPLQVEDALIADVIDNLLRRVGAKLVSTSRASRGEHPDIPKSRARLRNFSTNPNRSVYEEVVQLAQVLSDATGHRHRIVPANDETSVASFRLVDQDDREPEREALRINYQADTVHALDVTPTSKESQPQPITVGEDEATVQEAEQQTRSFQLRASVAFDPRINLGSYIVVQDGDRFRGSLTVESVTHNIGKWNTNFSGEVQEANL